MVEKEDSTTSHLEKLTSVILVKELKSIGQNPYLPQYPPPYSNVKAPQNSSPVQSKTDPVKLLSQFFKWLANQPKFNSKRQRAILEPIKDKLVEEEWNINLLKSQKLGKGITSEQWETYSFKIGTLYRIRPLISKFKQLR